MSKTQVDPSTVSSDHTIHNALHNVNYTANLLDFDTQEVYFLCIMSVSVTPSMTIFMQKITTSRTLNLLCQYMPYI